MNVLVYSVLSACVLQNLCVIEKDAFDVTDVNENEVCQDGTFARDGH